MKAISMANQTIGAKQNKSDAIVLSARYKDIALKLAQAETESKVQKIIDDDTELSDHGNWLPFNGDEKNWPIIGNQQAAPVPALTEKITNSIDAMLLRRCKEEGIDPESAVAPKTMRDAI